ncbi:hypothetical protein BD769DRAFT_1524469 [Suillus cothurnatus]|nr:hypothetical protein BD769DRAFT_1524469 [Suillus cothurnatus]
MSRRLEDLEEFWKRVVEMRPWEYDHMCVPLSWRPVNPQETKLKFGVIWEMASFLPLLLVVVLWNGSVMHWRSKVME